VLHYVIPQQPDRAALQEKAAAGNQQPLAEQDGSGSTSSCSFMRAVDQALPPPLLQHLQHVFRPGADFWQQHAYGRVGYFSYFFPLVRVQLG
jgi:hypothetical protein